MNALYPLFVSIISMCFAISNNAWAHGENKPGPHGGVIRMPGAFHTEIKEKNKTSFEVYVLDMEWKNPIVKGSTLSVKWMPKGKADETLMCKPKQKNFVCQLPKGKRLNSGDIVTILATRAGSTGAAVNYEYPFRPTPMESGGGHDGHH